MKKSFFLFLFCGLALLPVFVNADTWGNRENQELSDVVFRDLSFAINIHSGIYGGRVTSRLPGTVFDDEVVEMTGVLTTKLCFKGLCADAVANVSALPLLDFQKKGKNYYGAFKHMDDLQLLKRKAIRAIAYDEFLSKAKPAVPYVVQSGDFMGTLLTRYIIYDDANNDGIIGRSEIRAMRSDAFVEYCYAAAGVPIIKDNGIALNITQVEDAEKLNDWYLSSLSVTPVMQRANMKPAVINSPQAAVFEDETGLPVSQNQLIKARSIWVLVNDTESGPGGLDFLFGSYGDYTTNPRMIPGPNIDSTEQNYLFPPSDMGELAAGEVTLTAYDHAGNSSSQFRFNIPPGVKASADSVFPLYESFEGVSETVPSTIEDRHEFIFSEPHFGVSSVTITGPQGTLVDWSFDPPTSSTMITLGDLPGGLYNVKSANAVGMETITPFKISTMTAAILPEHSTQTCVYDNLLALGTFYNAINLNFNSEDEA